jgi:hypothetical protein
VTAGGGSASADFEAAAAAGGSGRRQRPVRIASRIASQSASRLGFVKAFAASGAFLN